jgi:enoyl-CoA hydratase/carnithine racemase
MPSARYEKSGAVGHIVLCNPPLNLLNVVFYEQLRDAVLSATSDDLRAVLVRAVAAVRGHVFGGGVELVLSCDFIVAAADATFRQIEVSVGNMPMAGGVQRMAERIGQSRAVLYAMLSLPMTGETAGELGLASFVVPAEEVENRAVDLAQELANGPTRSYEAVRQILKAWSAGGVAGADAVMLDVAFSLHEATAAARQLAAEKTA